MGDDSATHLRDYSDYATRVAVQDPRQTVAMDDDVEGHARFHVKPKSDVDRSPLEPGSAP